MLQSQYPFENTYNLKNSIQILKKIASFQAILLLRQNNSGNFNLLYKSIVLCLVSFFSNSSYIPSFPLVYNLFPLNEIDDFKKGRCFELHQLSPNNLFSVFIELCNPQPKHTHYPIHACLLLAVLLSFFPLSLSFSKTTDERSKSERSIKRCMLCAHNPLQLSESFL